MKYAYYIDPETGKFMPKHWIWNLWACIKYAKKLKKRGLNPRIKIQSDGFHVWAGGNH